MDITINQVQAGASFGCCHRYRECSDAKHCLLTDSDQLNAQNCSYRTNLEQGRIFYGKNANDFSADVYNEWLLRYKKTSGILRNTLDELILFFSGDARLSSQVIWFFSEEIEELQQLGFINYTHNHTIVLNQYLMEDLRKASGEKIRKKDELIRHIICNQPDVLAKLSAPYCYLHIPKSIRIYIYEIYYDFFYKTVNNRYLGPIPFPKKVKEDVSDDGYIN